MKYLIASDLHGNATYAQKVIDAFNKHHADILILGGDLLYHGPRNPLIEGYDPKKVVEILNPYQDKIIACRGNCDSEVDQMVLNFNIENTLVELFDNNRKIFISHGHHFNPDNLPVNMQANDIFIFGHIHVPKHYQVDGKFIINPGSTTLPKENSFHSYAILENDECDFYNLLTDELYYHFPLKNE